MIRHFLKTVNIDEIHNINNNNTKFRTPHIKGRVKVPEILQRDREIVPINSRGGGGQIPPCPRPPPDVGPVETLMFIVPSV